MKEEAETELASNTIQIYANKSFYAYNSEAWVR